MINYISKKLGIDIIPKGLLTHLWLIAFFLGGLNAILFISAISGFINDSNLGYYPETIALSGLFGVSLFALSKFLVKKFPYRFAFIIFYAAVLACISIATFLPVLSDSFSESFLLFVCFLPITIISDQMLLDISEKLSFYKFQQNIKRFLEGGLITGTFVFSLGIAAFSLFGVQNIIFWPAALLILVIGMEANIILKQYEPKEITKDERINSVITLFTDVPLKFTILVLVLFVFLSIVNFVFIDYVFLYTLSRSFAGLQNLIQFTALFLAAIMVVNMLFKLFVYQNLIKTFKINKAVLLSPVFILLVLVLINSLLFIPSHADYYKPTIILFTVIVFARFFSFILRESFELYSVRLIFTAISSYSQQWISQNIINLLYIWAFLFGGLALLFYTSFDFMNIRYVLGIITFMAICWLWASIVLIRNYSIILRKIGYKLSVLAPKPEDEKMKNLKERVMLTTNLAGMKYLLNFQRNNQPYNFENTYSEIKDAVASKMDNSQTLQQNNYASKLNVPNGILGNFEQNQQINYYDTDENLKINDIEILASSPKTKDRIRAIKMVETAKDLRYVGLFKMLMRDQNEEVQRRAFLAVSQFYNTEIITELVEYLVYEEYSNLISDVLAKIGDEVIPHLNTVFIRSDIDTNTQVQIIRTVGRMNSLQAIDFLLKILEYPNKWLVGEAADAINEHKLKPDLKNNPVLHRAIIKTIGIVTWLLSKEISIDRISPYEPIFKALDEEYSISLDLLFILLQIKYNNPMISRIKKEFVTLTNNEIRELNVELINLIIEPELKTYLFPLIHNNRKTERIEQLKKYFPVSHKDMKSALKDIINADLGYVNTWSKACALKLYIDIEENILADEILAQVFNPDITISELAFFGIYKKNRQVAAGLMDRVSVKFKNRILSIIESGENYEHKLNFYKVLNLQKISYFDKIYGQNLIPFAQVLKENFMEAGDATYLHCSDEEVLPVFIIPEGQMALIDSQKRHVRLYPNYLYGLGLFAGGITLKAYSDSVLYIARPEQIGRMVINQEEISDAIFKYIQNSNFY
jgi:hypothetical protein